MYNSERKQQYIKENNNFIHEEVFERQMFVLFTHTEKMETRLQKDACNFSYTEILDFHKSLATSSLDRLVVANNHLDTYCAWCNKNGYVLDGLNHYSEITSDVLNTCVNYGKQRELFISRKDILKEIAGFWNAYEQAMILSLYEGLSLSDLEELRMENVDVKERVVHIPQGRDLPISRELIHYMEDSASTYERFGEDGKKTHAVNLDLTDDRIIKAFRKKTQIDNRTIAFFNILRRIKAYYGYPWLSAAVLPQAGAANMLLELWKADEGKSVAEVASEHMEEIRFRYGMNWNYNKRFQLKYGFIFE